MPLHDHFRSPVNDRHSWDGLYGGWPCMIVRQLVAVLPEGFRSGPQINLGRYFEVNRGTDVDQQRAPSTRPELECEGNPTFTVEAELTAEAKYEVRIYDTEFGRDLVAAIEIVCPTNKDRAASRALFIAKVASMVKQGICVTLIDPVSIRAENLYVELFKLLDLTDSQLSPTPPPRDAVTLRARKPPKRRHLLDAWFYPMAVGQPLPTLPIWLAPDLGIMLPLETSYAETCRVLGIGSAESA